MIFEREHPDWWQCKGGVFCHDGLKQVFQVPDDATRITILAHKKPGPDRQEVFVRRCEFCGRMEFTFKENDLWRCLDVKIKPGTYYLECWYEV